MSELDSNQQRGHAATTARNRDEAQDIIMASEEALGQCYDAATRNDLASRITEALDAATSSPTPAESWIDKLAGTFDDSPVYAEVIANEKRARQWMEEGRCVSCGALPSDALAERTRVEGEQDRALNAIEQYAEQLLKPTNPMATATGMQVIANEIIARVNFLRSHFVAAPADNDAEHVCFTLNQERDVITCSRCGTRFWSDLTGTFRINHTCRGDR